MNHICLNEVPLKNSLLISLLDPRGLLGHDQQNGEGYTTIGNPVVGERAGKLRFLSNGKGVKNIRATLVAAREKVISWLVSSFRKEVLDILTALCIKNS